MCLSERNLVRSLRLFLCTHTYLCIGIPNVYTYWHTAYMLQMLHGTLSLSLTIFDYIHLQQFVCMCSLHIYADVPPYHDRMPQPLPIYNNNNSYLPSTYCIQLLKQQQSQPLNIASFYFNHHIVVFSFFSVFIFISSGIQYFTVSATWNHSRTVLVHHFSPCLSNVRIAYIYLSIFHNF